MIDLYNSDCLKKLNELEEESIDLIVTDPPYRISSRGNFGSTGGMLKKDLSMKGKIFENNDILPSDYANLFYRVLKNNTHCYVMTNHINLQDMLNSFTDVGFHFIKSLIWDKHNKIMGRFYMSQFEYILFFRKGGERPINNCGTSDILCVPNKKLQDANGNNLHDTEKPVELMKILIENSTNKGEVVLDPFMGIGSTALACKQLDRDFIGIEIDEKYFNITKDRIENKVITNDIKRNKLF